MTENTGKDYVRGRHDYLFIAFPTEVVHKARTLQKAITITNDELKETATGLTGNEAVEYKMTVNYSETLTTRPVPAEINTIILSRCQNVCCICLNHLRN